MVMYQHDQVEERLVHKSTPNKTKEWHACVETTSITVPQTDSENTVNIGVILFGAYNTAINHSRTTLMPSA